VNGKYKYEYKYMGCEYKYKYEYLITNTSTSKSKHNKAVPKALAFDGYACKVILIVYADYADYWSFKMSESYLY
jgi:hypothetical protein